MVGFKGESGVKNSIVIGKNYIIQGFSGQHDFSFSSQATQIFKEPVAYAMLVYPDSVAARVVRKAIRTKISLPAIASLHGNDIAHDVTLKNVNMSGAKMDSVSRIGPPGELVNLSFEVDVEKSKVNVALPCSIRYTTKSESGDGYSTGVEFKDITRDNQLVLHYITTQAYESGSSDVVL